MWRELTDWTNWGRVGIALAGVVVFYVAMAVVGLVVDGPARAIAEYAGSFGLGGSLLLIAAAIGVPLAIALTAERREQRRRIAQTGILDHRKPTDWETIRTYTLAVSLALSALAALLYVIHVRGLTFPS